MRSIVMLAAGASLYGCTTTAVDLTAELQALRARGEGIVAAESAMDTEGAMAFWAPDGIVLPANAPIIQGHDGIRALYREFFNETVKSFGSTVTDIHVSASGDMAWEYGVNRLVLNGPDGDILDLGKYLATWKKIDGEWFVAAVSFSSDAPPPPPTD